MGFYSIVGYWFPYFYNPLWYTLIEGYGYLNGYWDHLINENEEYVGNVFVQWYENENEDELLNTLTNILEETEDE
jgi:hypothetical protein